jgi:transposase
MKNDIGKFASVGIDLGDLVGFYVCLDENGQAVKRGQVGMTVVAFEKEFRGLKPTRMAIEVGAQSRWVSKQLRAMGHEVIVANPRQVKLISASQSKSDPNDAMLLARLARVDATLLAPVEHRGEDEQKDLAAIRARALLVGQRVALMNAVKGVGKEFGIRLPSATSEKYVERTMERLPERLRVSLAGQFGMIVALSEQIADYDELIEGIAEKRYPAAARLRSVPGVGTLTALTFVLTIASVHQMAAPPHFVRTGTSTGTLARDGFRAHSEGVVRDTAKECGWKQGPIGRSKRWVKCAQAPSPPPTGGYSRCSARQGNPFGVRCAKP